MLTLHTEPCTDQSDFLSKILACVFKAKDLTIEHKLHLDGKNTLEYETNIVQQH